MLKGHCECGRVGFEVDGEIEEFSHCQCSQCRRLHGAAFATFATVRRDRFRYTSGASEVSHYASSERNDRVFCSRCGSPILVDSRGDPEVLYLSMSTLDGDPKCPEGYHAWVGSKAPWYEIRDTFKQFDAAPTDD